MNVSAVGSTVITHPLPLHADRSSWLNLVERFFADLTSDVIRDGSFRSVPELVRAIESYLADRNADPQRYTWHTKGEAILAKIQRAKEALANVN